MQRESPPKHRHDGTSPLPLGMDWSPPPWKWNGRDTVWPHNPHTGWSYCVTVPSWAVLPKSRDPDPVVFYRVQVGIQSPEGITTTRGVLRRFNDFLKLFSALKKAFPRKNIPPAPPKGLLRLKTRALLDERRCALEEWMSKLLSDIDLSRSAPVASFLELEAAARSSFQNENQNSTNDNPSAKSTVTSLHDHSNSSMLDGTTLPASDYGSDTAYETSDVGTPSLGREDNSEVGTEDLSMDEDFTSPIEKLMKYGMSNIDEGLFMGEAILEQLEGFPKNKVHSREINSVIRKITNNRNSSKAAYLTGDGMELLSESDQGNKVIGHARKLSTESVGSDVSSLRCSESSPLGFPGIVGNGPFELPGGAEVSRTTEILSDAVSGFPDDAQLVLPLDQRNKMNRLLVALQRRLMTSRTDMEDLISRLNQEITVKDYLSTKVKDLEVELETTKQRSTENLQQAILIERERFTQMQWDMEELRKKSMEMELKLKSQQDGKLDTAESASASTIQEKYALIQELDATKQQFEDTMKRHDELEKKTKADIKVLVKEVKSLRSSQTELKQELSQSLMETAEAQRLLQKERRSSEHAKAVRRKLIHECGILQNRLQECSIFVAEGEDRLIINSSSLSDAMDLLTTSDERVWVLLAEAQLLAQEDEEVHEEDDDGKTIDEELRQMLINIFTSNASLRKQVNSVIRCAFKMDISSEKDAPSVELLLNKVSEK